MQKLDKLMDLLKNNQRFHVTYKKGFSNHLSMSLIALYFLNAEASKLQSFYDNYIKQLEHISPSDLAITGINWQQHLGSGRNYWSYYKYFRAKKSMLGLEQVLRDYLPRLMKGVVGSLFHPLIRLAYALELWNYAGAQNNQQLTSLAEEESIIALAYWADSYAELPVYSEQNKVLNVLLKQLLSGKPGNNTNPSDILQRIKNNVINDSSYIAFSAKVTPANDNMQIFTNEASQLYLAYQDFFLLHIVTSLHALRIIMDFLPKNEAISSYWNAFLAVYLSLPKLENKKAPKIRNNAPDEIQDKLSKISDEHSIKLLYTAVQELEFYQNNNYLGIINLIIG